MTHELMQLAQTRDETVAEFMARVQAPRDKSCRKNTTRTARIAVAKFCSGLANKDAARTVSIHAKSSVSHVLRIANSMLA